MIKTVIFLFQLGFINDSVVDCPLNRVSARSNFDITFLLNCIEYCAVFLGYWVGNLMRIPKMCLKLALNSVLQAILSLAILLTVFTHSLTVPIL